MRLLCVYANRKMAVVLTNFSATFPFVTCVKESENQPNGLVESRRKSYPSPKHNKKRGSPCFSSCHNADKYSYLGDF